MFYHCNRSHTSILMYSNRFTSILYRTLGPYYPYLSHNISHFLTKIIQIFTVVFAMNCLKAFKMVKAAFLEKTKNISIAKYRFVDDIKIIFVRYLGNRVHFFFFTDFSVGTVCIFFLQIFLCEWCIKYKKYDTFNNSHYCNHGNQNLMI